MLKCGKSTSIDWAKRNAFERLKHNHVKNKSHLFSLPALRSSSIVFSLSRGIVPHFFPAQLQINLCNSCARKKFPKGDCVNCSFPAADKGEIDPDTLLVSLSKFSEYQGNSIFLSGGGEPGEYRYLETLLEYLATNPLGARLELTLNTNGAFAHRIIRLVERRGSESKKWISALKTIFSQQRGGSYSSMISVSWHDDTQGTNAVRALAKLRSTYQLFYVIRVSSLVYGQPSQIDTANPVKRTVGGCDSYFVTTTRQVDEIVNQAAENGADMVCFKPAHIVNNGYRSPATNQDVYDFVMTKFYQQCSEAADHGWDWERCRELKSFRVVWEKSDRLNRLKESYNAVVKNLETQKFLCIAPLATLFLSPSGVAVCCDTWAPGLGSKELFLKKNLGPPASYYPSALRQMCKTFPEIWPHGCVLGCGWTEFNLTNALSRVVRTTDGSLTENLLTKLG